MTIFLVLGLFAGLYMLWLLFSLAVYALPLATGVSLAFWMHDHGHGYPASILDAVVPGMPAYEEELFGPVASILRVKDEAEAVRVANDTTFGLGGSVWTGDKERGNHVARQLQCGAAFVNAVVRSDVRLPFGGIKRSGFGRELAEHGIHEFMTIKSVYVA